MALDFCLRYGGTKNNKSRNSTKPEAKTMKQLAILGLIALLAGCATIDGIGQDVSGAARGVQSML